MKEDAHFIVAEDMRFHIQILIRLCGIFCQTGVKYYDGCDLKAIKRRFSSVELVYLQVRKLQDVFKHPVIHENLLQSMQSC